MQQRLAGIKEDKLKKERKLRWREFIKLKGAAANRFEKPILRQPLLFWHLMASGYPDYPGYDLNESYNFLYSGVGGIDL